MISIRSKFQKSLQVCGGLAGIATSLLGLVVIFGWHVGNSTLIQVLPQFVPMQYNTALGFVFSGLVLTMLVTGRRRAGVIFGAIATLIGGLTLVEYIGGVNLGIDELFMDHNITVGTSNPGRMAPNTAVCFTLFGLSALVRTRRLKPTHSLVLTVILGSVTLGLGVVALSGYLASLETAYGWGNLTRMAVHTSVGFVVVSGGLLCFVWSLDAGNRDWLPGWMPIPLCVGVLTTTICFWQAISADNASVHEIFTHMSGIMTDAELSNEIHNPQELEQRVLQRSFPIYILFGGGLLSIALPLMVYFSQKSSRLAKGLEATVDERTQDLSRINYLSDIALELTDCGYWHVDYSDPDYYYQSERASSILGEAPKSDGRFHLQDEWFARLLEANPETAEKTAERYQGAIEDKYEHYESTYAYKRPNDGKIVWVHALGKTVHDDDGKIQYMYGVYQDVTDQIHAEEVLNQAKEKAEAATQAMRSSENQVRSIIESAADGIVTIDEKGTIMSFNSSASEMFGYTADELIGTNVKILMPAHDHGHHDSYLQNYLRTGVAKIIGLGGREVIAQRKDKTTFPIELKVSESCTGNQRVFIGLIRDITERKKLEERLQKLSRALEQSPTSVIITDVDGHIEYVNPKFSEVTGYSANEVYGKNPRILKSDQQSSPFYKELWETISAGMEWRGELCNRKKNGELYWEAASISPVRNPEGEITHFVAVKEDITERRQVAEELREAKEAADAANRAKSDFLANMSHEIRTPMNGVIGMTELALDTDLTPEQRDYLNTIQSSADALLTLINDILDFSKIEAGKLELEPIDFGLRDSLADILNTLATRAYGKGLELIYDVPSDVQDALVGDVYRLRQIIVNLVGNAIKFTERGEIVISVKQVRRTEKETTLHFSVRDTGIGISPKKLDAVFKPFSQADVSTTRQYGGTGLGLAISVQLIELMHGRIWAESELGKGSTFHFTVVLGIGKPVAAPETKVQLEMLEDLPVLVVDDNATNRRILKDIFKNWRMSPQVVESGEEALASLDRASNTGRSFRLVVSDVNMPEMDGFELFERMPERYKDVPFILLTSGMRRGDAARCVEMGITAHLIKPVKQSLLLNAIMSAIGAPALAAQQKPEAVTTANDTDVKRSLHILLAEDNKTNQKFAVRTIEKAGHSVVIANNGLEVMEAWEQDAYDIILMDVHMPEMDGLEATTKIREKERECAERTRTPIIAMTAKAMKGDREQCLDAGMDGYVSKPVKRETLFAEIDRVLDRQSDKEFA